MSKTLKKKILIGTHYHSLVGNDVERVSYARGSLMNIRNALIVNLQYIDENYEYDNIMQLKMLRMDSRQVSRRKGIRKPITREMLDILSETALKEEIEYICISNNDIIIENQIEELLRYDYDGIVFSRFDIDDIGKTNGSWFYSGYDTFILKNSWYQINKSRFRNYIIGEGMWDLAYMSIVMVHGNSILIDCGKPYIYHIRHKVKWHNSPYAYYNMYLSCLDQLYINMRNEYLAYRKTKDDQDFSIDSMNEINRKFKLPAPGKEFIKHQGRIIKATLRYFLQRYKIIKETNYPAK